jgi:ubiquinone/menaquinone biosynthesis C-methylase UbiE
MARGWDRHRALIAEAGRPVMEALVADLEPRSGQTILEVAAGTGEVGFVVASSVERVILTDFAPEMVAVARRVAGELRITNVECRVMDAEDMTLDDASCDGVICRWGYMLMPRPARALEETRRVLRPGGRLAFAVFAEPAKNPWASLAVAVLSERGHLAPLAAGTPGIFALHDRDRLRVLVEGAGFSRVAVRDVPHAWRFTDAAAYWDFLHNVAGAISMTLGQLDEATRDGVRTEIDKRLEAYRATDGGYVLPGIALAALAI